MVAVDNKDGSREQGPQGGRDLVGDLPRSIHIFPPISEDGASPRGFQARIPQAIVHGPCKVQDISSEDRPLQQANHLSRSIQSSIEN